MIISRSPLRISFVGGGTDISPYCDEHGGAVINTTINKYAWGGLKTTDSSRIKLNALDVGRTTDFSDISELKDAIDIGILEVVVRNLWNSNTGLQVHLTCEAPPKSGLGSSASCFASIIGLIDHANGGTLDRKEIAELAHILERDELGNRGGRQDQYASVFGGLNYMEFGPDDEVTVVPLELKEAHLQELEDNLLLLHVKERNASGTIITEQMSKYAKRDVDVVESLHMTKGLVEEARLALTKGDFIYFGDLMNKAWEYKKRFSKSMTDPNIDKIYRIAREAGAMGGKISGAGGGGHMFLFCESGKSGRVADALKKLDVQLIDFNLERDGLKTFAEDFDDFESHVRSKQLDKNM